MGRTRSIRRAIVLMFAVMSTATPAMAQTAGSIEIGSALANVAVLLPEHGDTDTLFGIPSGTFGLVNPTFYTSFFVSSHVAIEPQLGVLVERTGGHTNHVLNGAGQLDLFVTPAARSAYIFGAVGIVDVSGSSTNPKTLSAGVGYRVPVGSRLAFRFDGRYSHFTESDGNEVALTISIGGLLKP